MSLPRHTKAHFDIDGRVDNAQGGRLTVDRRLGLVTVRPKGKRRTYVLPLVDVANIIVCKVVKAELPRE
jgi:hypothetical protein